MSAETELLDELRGDLIDENHKGLLDAYSADQTAAAIAAKALDLLKQAIDEIHEP